MIGQNFLIITILCIVAYINSLRCGFVFDDFPALVNNSDLFPNKTSIWDLLEHDFWGTPLDREDSHKSYRPLTVLTFRLQYWLHGLNTIYFHAINLLLHCIVSCLFFILLKTIISRIYKRKKSNVAFTSALLFILHPVHTEAVTGLVGRAELLSAFFFILGLIIHIRFNNRISISLISVLFAFLATFTKEQGVTLVAACCIWDFIVPNGKNTDDVLYLHILKKFKNSVVLGRFLILVIGAICILLTRIRMLYGELPVFTSGDNPASVAAFPIRHFTFCHIWTLNIWLLFCPCGLCADWSMSTIDLVNKLIDSRNAISSIVLCLYLLITIICLRSRSATMRLIFFTIFALHLLPFVPASNIFIRVGFVIAERVLYIPSFGFCFIVALGYHKLLLTIESRPRLVLIMKFAFYFTLSILCSKCILRNIDWIDDYSLFTSALRISTNNAKSFNNIGHALERRGESKLALKYFTRASHVQPDDIGSWINIGRVQSELGNYDDAELAFKRALSLFPCNHTGRVALYHLNIFINLGNLYKNQSRLREAENLYRRAIRIRPDFIPAYQNLGDLLMLMNRPEEAVSIFQSGLKLNDKKSDLWYNAGIAFMRLNLTEKAYEYFEQALMLENDHFYALVNSALLIFEKDNLGEDEKELVMNRLEKAISLRLDDIRIVQLLVRLGNLQYEENIYEKAEMNFQRAVEFDPSNRMAMLNLAIVQADNGKLSMAVSTLENGLKMHPTFVKGWLTLCGLYSDTSKNTEYVEQWKWMEITKNCYEKVLYLDSTNIPARHNLCIILINLGREEKVAECIEEAKKMVNLKNGYSMEHANILENKLRQANL